MKREDLKKLNLTDEQIDSIMGMNGADIETHKRTTTDLQSQLDAITGQLGDANKAIESFKALKPEELQKAADDWKTKYETATQESAAQLQKVKFDYALESALNGAKAKNLKAVRALLSTDQLKLKDDGTLEGFEDQLTKIKAENDYLFTDAKEPPKIVSNANNQTVIGDPLEAAMRRGAGLASPQGK